MLESPLIVSSLFWTFWHAFHFLKFTNPITPASTNFTKHMSINLVRDVILFAYPPIIVIFLGHVNHRSAWVAMLNMESRKWIFSRLEFFFSHNTILLLYPTAMLHIIHAYMGIFVWLGYVPAWTRPGWDAAGRFPSHTRSEVVVSPAVVIPERVLLDCGILRYAILNNLSEV